MTLSRKWQETSDLKEISSGVNTMLDKAMLDEANSGDIIGQAAEHLTSFIYDRAATLAAISESENSVQQVCQKQQIKHVASILKQLKETGDLNEEFMVIVERKLGVQAIRHAINHIDVTPMEASL